MDTKISVHYCCWRLCLSKISSQMLLEEYGPYHVEMRYHNNYSLLEDLHHQLLSSQTLFTFAIRNRCRVHSKWLGPDTITSRQFPHHPCLFTTSLNPGVLRYSKRHPILTQNSMNSLSKRKKEIFLILLLERAWLDPRDGFHNSKKMYFNN